MREREIYYGLCEVFEEEFRDRKEELKELSARQLSDELVEFLKSEKAEKRLKYLDSLKEEKTFFVFLCYIYDTCDFVDLLLDYEEVSKEITNQEIERIIECLRRKDREALMKLLLNKQRLMNYSTQDECFSN
jgi:hypothetical protein